MKPHPPFAASVLTDFGMIGGHRWSGAAEVAALLVDETQVLACTPGEYTVAVRLLHSGDTPVPFDAFALSRVALTHAVSRLRRKLAPLGLAIQCELQHGYVLQRADKNPGGGNRNPAPEEQTMNDAPPPTSAAMTSGFQASYTTLPSAIRRVAMRKIALLEQNPAHPSLHVHRVKRRVGLWECAITGRYRLLFERDGEQITLVEIGPHGVIDHVHHRRR